MFRIQRKLKFVKNFIGLSNEIKIEKKRSHLFPNEKFGAKVTLRIGIISWKLMLTSSNENWEIFLLWIVTINLLQLRSIYCIQSVLQLLEEIWDFKIKKLGRDWIGWNASKRLKIKVISTRNQHTDMKRVTFLSKKFLNLSEKLIPVDRINFPLFNLFPKKGKHQIFFIIYLYLHPPILRNNLKHISEKIFLKNLF